MGFLKRADLIGRKVFRTFELDTGNGEKLRLRRPTGEEYKAFLADVSDDAEGEEPTDPNAKPDPQRVKKQVSDSFERGARLIASLALDDEGKPLFEGGYSDADVAAIRENVDASILADVSRLVARAIQEAQTDAGGA